MEPIASILHTLGVPESPARVYLELLKDGEMSPRLLARRLSMSRPSIYDHIKVLERYGLVDVRELDNKLAVQASDPSVLEKLLGEQQERIHEELRAYKKIAAHIRRSYHHDSPRIKFFDGADAVRRALHDILWSGKSELLALWPYVEMVEMLGKPFLTSFNEKRMRHHIKIRTIWPVQKKIRSHIWEGSDTGVTRRYLTNSVPVTMGYTIYEDKVIFVSSTKECFGFTIASREFANLMRMQFELTWSTAHTALK